MARLRLLLATVMLGTLLLVPATASAARPDTGGLLTNVPVSGLLSTGGSANGTLTITDISRSGSQLLFDGTLTIAGVTTTFTDVVGALVPGGAPAVCDILFLDLGPIALDLLGLTIDLSQVTLDINAVSGAGNLLGNLLCAVAGLLDGGLTGSLGTIVDRLLGVINGLLA
ncbi:MAG TPA: hypothetical protein VFK35_06930 [Candidatus Limnocylindrales bacterium]|nr:hypothetical protein [Candidatus Limnocylindrales bacterium]